MKLTKRDISVLGGGYYVKTKNYDLLVEFLDSGMDVAEVEGFTHKSAATCTASLSNSIRNFKIGGIRAVTRNGRVYLVRTNKPNKE